MTICITDILADSLVSIGCYSKMPYTGWLKRQTFISHSSGSWELQVQGTARLFLVRTNLLVRNQLAAVLLGVRMTLALCAWRERALVSLALLMRTLISLGVLHPQDLI